MEPLIKIIDGIEVVILSGVNMPDSEIIMPKTEKPFPSWRWVINEHNIAYWDSPVIMPREDGKIFRWDEESLSWILVN